MILLKLKLNMHFNKNCNKKFYTSTITTKSLKRNQKHVQSQLIMSDIDNSVTDISHNIWLA